MSERGAVHTIGQVSDQLGVPAPTIRSWERRYGLQPERHTIAGHRRYDDGDVDVLRRMRDEVAAGRRPSEAAALAKALRMGTLTTLVAAMCEAAHRLDDVTIGGVLDLARSLHGLPATMDQVLLPAMRELGRQWANGECDVAHEHIATTAVQTWLKGAAPDSPLDDLPVAVVLAAAPQDLHTLALDALAVLLAHRGLRCLQLGARVPEASLRTAVLDSHAPAVVVCCQLPTNRRSATAALRGVLDTPAGLYYCGAAFTTAASRRGVPGHYLGDNLARAADELVAGTNPNAH